MVARKQFFLFLGSLLTLVISVTALAQERAEHSPNSFVLGTGARSRLASPYARETYFSDIYAYQVNDWLEHGYSEIEHGWGNAEPRPIKIMIKPDSMRFRVSTVFVDTLSSEKARLMSMYGLTNSEYNRLAMLAFGILGAETNLSVHPLYWTKENFPGIVTFAKEVMGQINRVIGLTQFDRFVQAVEARELPPVSRVGLSSRGPTQIKDIPVAVARHYHINADNVHMPQKSAVATLAFLAERLAEMRIRVRSLPMPYVNETNIYDYVLYAYQGNMDEIFADTTTPSRNLYLQTVRRYMRGLVLLERE